MRMRKDYVGNKKSKFQTLKMLYETNITIDSIAERLMLCESGDSSLIIKEELTKRNFDVIGVRDGNEIIGYVERGDLEEGTIRDYVRPFHTREIISDSTPLIQFLHLFKNRRRMFVLEKNEVTQLITYADLQKPPVRILIFGYMTLLEMNLGELIQVKYENQSWQGFLGGNRLTKAEALFKERQAKNEDISLIECLQISDKMQIIMNAPGLLDHFEIQSKSEWKRTTAQVRDLRDRIAHSNALGIDVTWEEITTTLETCEDLLKVIERLLEEG